MIFIFKLILSVVSLFVFLTIVGGLSLAFKIRHAMRNPFDRVRDDPASSSAKGGGDIIEGEYEVLSEKKDV